MIEVIIIFGVAGIVAFGIFLKSKIDKKNAIKKITEFNERTAEENEKSRQRIDEYLDDLQCFLDIERNGDIIAPSGAYHESGFIYVNSIHFKSEMDWFEYREHTHRIYIDGVTDISVSSFNMEDAERIDFNSPSQYYHNFEKHNLTYDVIGFFYPSAKLPMDSSILCYFPEDVLNRLSGTLKDIFIQVTVTTENNEYIIWTTPWSYESLIIDLNRLIKAHRTIREIL